MSTVFAEFANAETTLNTADNEDGSRLLGATSSGTYECNYTAVYHLMTHEEHMIPEDLFQYTLVQQ